MMDPTEAHSLSISRTVAAAAMLLLASALVGEALLAIIRLMRRAGGNMADRFRR